MIILNGYIDTYNSVYFQKQIGKVVATGFVNLIFNCSNLNYVSSTGIGSFTSFLKLVKAKNGDIYIGTTTGLNIVDCKTGKITNITKEDGIANDYIMCITQTPDGRIWCGTDGGGIFILKDRKVDEIYNHEKGLSGNVVFKIINLEVTGINVVVICDSK